MIKVDPITMLVEGFTKEEAEDMLRVCKDIVLKGTIPYPRPQWMNDWFDACGFDERQQLLTISVVLVPHILLSLLINSYKDLG